LIKKRNDILQSYAASVRWDVFRLWKKWEDVLSGTLSIVDLYVAFYLEYSVKDFKDSLDNIPRVIPKSTSAPALYSVLAYSGLLNTEVLEKESPPEFDQTIPGITAIDGNLGHSLSQAVGFAMAGKISDEHYLVFCFMGDGELQEGIDHAAKYAATMQLNNLCIVVDCNQIQSRFYTADVDHTMQQDRNGSFAKLKNMWSSYGWDVVECDGHDFDQILDSYKQAGKGRSPLVILAKTIKGKGFPKIEGKLLYAHGIKEPQLAKEAEKYFFQTKSAQSEIQYGKYYSISKKNKYPNVIIPNCVKEKTDTILYDTFFLWIKEFTKRNPKKVITINTDNTKLVGGRNTILYNAEHYSPHLFLGLNERFAVNFGRGVSHEGIYPIFTSPAVHLINTIDDWRSACMDKDPILICGFAPGSTLYKIGKTHVSYHDIQMYKYPDAHIYQPATHEDLILLLNEIYNDPKNTLPGYIRLHNLGREEEYNLHLHKKDDNKHIFKDGFYIIKSSKYFSGAPQHIVIIVSGILLKEAIGAGKFLEEKGVSYIIINVINFTDINKEKFQNITREASLIISLIDATSESLSTLIFNNLHEEKRILYVPLGIDGRGSFDPPSKVYRKNCIDTESIVNFVRIKFNFEF